MPHACAWLICSLGDLEESLKHIVTVFLIHRNWNKRRIRMKRKMSDERKEFSIDSALTHTSSTDAHLKHRCIPLSGSHFWLAARSHEMEGVMHSRWDSDIAASSKHSEIWISYFLSLCENPSQTIVFFLPFLYDGMGDGSLIETRGCFCLIFSPLL